MVRRSLKILERSACEEKLLVTTFALLLSFNIDGRNLKILESKKMHIFIKFTFY